MTATNQPPQPSIWISRTLYGMAGILGILGLLLAGSLASAPADLAPILNMVRAPWIAALQGILNQVLLGAGILVFLFTFILSVMLAVLGLLISGVRRLSIRIDRLENNLPPPQMAPTK